MTYTVSSTDLSNIDFDRSKAVDSILQNIAVILSTPLGSVPQHRDFGLDMSFLSKPESLASNLMVAPVREAIQKWEPRAQYVDMTLKPDPSVPGRMIPIVEVEIIDGE